MRAVKAFAQRVTWHMIESGEQTLIDNQRASDPHNQFFIDMGVYNINQVFRCVGACKQPPNANVPRHYLLPLGKTNRQEITKKEWTQALISNVSEETPVLQIPNEWYDC